MATKKSQPTSARPLKKETEQFEMLYPIVEAVYNEIKDLSKKKQDEPLNEIKVRMTNKVLQKVKIILKNDPTVEFLELLDDVTLPTNSDAVLIISQFKAAMSQFKDRHYTYTTSQGYTWKTSD